MEPTPELWLFRIGLFTGSNYFLGFAEGLWFKYSELFQKRQRVNQSSVVQVKTGEL